MELPRRLINCIVGLFKDYTPPDWDTFYMKLVYEIAKKSKDPSTKIGALIVGPDKEPISFGYNGFPRKVVDSVESYPERHQRPAKYMYYEHGERNAIYSVARVGGASLKGTTMYTQGLPCADCGRAIIQAGISEVVIHEPFELISRHIYNNWKESSDVTFEMFRESGVKVRHVQELIGVIGYVAGHEIKV
jgi:dCMP deaminase